MEWCFLVDESWEAREEWIGGTYGFFGRGEAY